MLRNVFELDSNEGQINIQNMIHFARLVLVLNATWMTVFGIGSISFGRGICSVQGIGVRMSGCRQWVLVFGVFSTRVALGFVWNGDADMCVHGSFPFVCMSMCAVCVCVCVHACAPECPWVCECLWVVRIKMVGHGEWMHRSDTCTGATSLWFQHQRTVFSKKCNASSRAHITCF